MMIAACDPMLRPIPGGPPIQDMDLLSERSQAMENEVAAGRVLLADKEVRLLAELAQKAKLQDK